MDRRKGKRFSLEVKVLDEGPFEFIKDEDELELLDAIAFHSCSSDSIVQLRTFMDGFWEVVRRRDIFVGYSQAEFEKLLGGVSRLDRYDASPFTATFR